VYAAVAASLRTGRPNFGELDEGRLASHRAMENRDSPLPIEKAPYRIRRAYYRAERRNSAIAVCVLLVAAGVVAFLIDRFVTAA
jgi:hypothetical protein